MARGENQALIVMPTACLKGFINWVAKLLCHDKLILNNRGSGL